MGRPLKPTKDGKLLIDYYTGKKAKLDDDHIATDDGRIFSIKANCFISPLEIMNRTVRHKHMITNDKKRWDECIAECFVPKPSPEHRFIYHKDGNMDNFHSDNLEWRTYPQRECYELTIHSKISKIRYHDMIIYIHKSSPPDIRVRCLIELYELLYDSPVVYY
jgi:hypothetical protein